MFNQTFVDGVQKTKEKYTIALSLLVEILALGFLVLLPLIYTQVLPNAQLKSLLMAPLPPRAPVPHILVDTPKSSSKIVVRQLNASLLTAPPRVPTKIAENAVDAAPELVIQGATGDPNGPANDVITGVIGSTGTNQPPPPPPAPPQTVVQKGPVPIGGNVAAANLIRQVKPVYPPLARSARVQGTVEFTAIISRTGDIEHLQLVRGHPLLVNAAKDAVVQWKYRPTLLNGQPVEVITDIIVNFTLGNN